MIDQQPQQHEMLLDKTYPTGVEEWYCPACGRRFVMQWPPKYKRIILNGGDEYAAHSGGKGGLKVGGMQIQSSEESTSPTEKDLPLHHWKSWLDSEDTSKWWPED
jgi:hypothetical protein